MDPTSLNKNDPTIEYSGSTSFDLGNDQKRRSSSRSIKRKKFDDEIVEYSLGLTPGTGRVRTQSQSAIFSSPTIPGVSTTTAVSGTGFTPNISSIISSPLPQTIEKEQPMIIAPQQPQTQIMQLQQQQVIQQQIPQTITVPQNPATNLLQQINQNASVNNEKRRGLKSTKKNKRKSGSHQVATKDLGRWKPVDDLALIIGIQQTNDLRMVHRGTKFSCKFTLQELQARWCSLLYEEPISRIAVTAMRNLHPELIESVQSKALYTQAEEDLLGTVKSTDSCTLETFQELLDKHASVFYEARTAKALFNHWQLMKQYQLLPDQNVTSLPKGDHILSFSDAEDLINDSELADNRDETLEIELALADRKNKKEIRTLENELTRWNVLVDSLTGVGFTPEFDNQTLAVLRGRLVRFLMRSREIVFGRSTKDTNVDVDLSLEGTAYKISRKQGTIKLRSNGDFFITNEGKRPIYIDGQPLLTGNKVRLNNNCVIEVSGLKFIFLINYDLINAIRQESAKMNIPFCTFLTNSVNQIVIY
uniref:Putative daxx-interacting protein n=1 Tax=Corethrella appendiculata TaxID=1370023 RepID=U5EYS7_9DIPT